METVFVEMRIKFGFLALANDTKTMQGHCTGQCFMKCSLLHTKRIMFPSLDI
jgi:hypothetical protein